MDKRYQVFISSTFSDLEEERNLIMKAILECDCFPAGMEMFPAQDIDQFEYIKQVIDKSDYYILIIAGKYGSLANDGISFTEKEYDYAVKQKIPVLAFIKNNIDNISARNTDQDIEKRQKLNAFREKVKKGRLIKLWDDKFELKSQIQSSLNEAFKSNPKKGWVRCDFIQKEPEYFESEIIDKDLQVSYKSNDEHKEGCVGISVRSIIELIGDFDNEMTCDDYELNICNIIQKQYPDLPDHMQLYCGQLNKSLELLDLIQSTGSWVDSYYNVRLTEKGKALYKRILLKDI
ncbi:DUF4062 domain-containing protein [[Clostridium] symbiosum]|uniref:DUF4062 domain-containing protein n=1 Tax=Clostridium symbiosum TaxID=1512 RepID=UPI0022E87621|nr:DUF4062 domain-containing protein [[Clostridium] symbiosum]